MEGFFKDLTHSLRMFRRSPGFTIAAVAALTLGIGTNTAIFTVVNAVLLKPVPFPDPNSLVMFMNTSPQGSGPAASPAKFAHWRAQTSVVRDAAAFRIGVVNYTGGEVPEQLRSAQVSADYFRLFGAPIVGGRGFRSEEDRPNGDKVVVIMRPPSEGPDPAPAVATLTTFRDGKVIEMVHYPDPEDALKAARA